MGQTYLGAKIQAVATANSVHPKQIISHKLLIASIGKNAGVIEFDLDWLCIPKLELPIKLRTRIETVKSWCEISLVFIAKEKNFCAFTQCFAEMCADCTV